MSFTQLHSIEIDNFRSISKTGEIRLDAPVVLIHGPNGAGKTSLLSAIELALTGNVASMQRVDSSYRHYLLRDGAEKGDIMLKMRSANGNMLVSSHVELVGKQVTGVPGLDPKLAQFFGERCFLAQASLTQLLNIYQQTGTGIDSPLTTFVRELLGLDRLDAIERGLVAALNVRNTRKLVPSLISAERNRDNLIQELSRAAGKVEAARAATEEAQLELNSALNHLNSISEGPAELLSNVDFDDTYDQVRLAKTLDAEKQLGAIERRNSLISKLSENVQRAALEVELNNAESQLQKWMDREGLEILQLMQRAATLGLVVNVPDTDIASQLSSMEASGLKRWRDFSR
jgi:exonuclease SbcC